MNQETFVKEVVELLIRDRSEKIFLESVEHPVGYPDHMKNALENFHQYSESQRDEIRAFVKLTIHTTIFRFLTILDGVSIISDNGRLRLSFVDNSGNETLLADDGADTPDYLHDIYMSDALEWLKD